VSRGIPVVPDIHANAGGTVVICGVRLRSAANLRPVQGAAEMLAGAGARMRRG
jgi:hypothetical protein